MSRNAGAMLEMVRTPTSDTEIEPARKEERNESSVLSSALMTSFFVMTEILASAPAILSASSSSFASSPEISPLFRLTL